MALSQTIQMWLTLTGHCFANFANAMAFGLYFSNLNAFSVYYDITTSNIINTFYIGLIFEILFCIPALKLI